MKYIIMLTTKYEILVTSIEVSIILFLAYLYKLDKLSKNSIFISVSIIGIFQITLSIISAIYTNELGLYGRVIKKEDNELIYYCGFIIYIIAILVCFYVLFNNLVDSSSKYTTR